MDRRCVWTLGDSDETAIFTEIDSCCFGFSFVVGVDLNCLNV